MKNREEELFIILQEEASEVVQAVSKRFRFGNTESNRKDVEQEIGDFIGVLKVLSEEGYLDSDKLFKAAEKKLKKLDTYMTNKRKLK